RRRAPRGPRRRAGRRAHDQGVRPAALPGRASRPRDVTQADPRRGLGLRLVRRPAHRRRAHRAGPQEGRRRLRARPGRAARAVKRPRGRLRNRLLVAMVAVSFGVLVLALLAAAALARQTSADAATKDLKKQAPAIAAELDSFGEQFRSGTLSRAGARVRATQVRRLVARVLAVSHSSVVTVQPDGRIVEGATGLLGLSANPAAQAAAAALTLPDGIKASDLHPRQLLAG